MPVCINIHIYESVIMCECFVFPTLLMPKVLTLGNTLTGGNQMINASKGLGELF